MEIVVKIYYKEIRVKFVVLMLSLVVIVFNADAKAQSINDRKCQYDSIEHALPCLQGESKGFAPTDESPIALGELSLTISGTRILYKMATGIKIETASADLKDFRLMTKDELLKIFKPEGVDKEFGLIKIGSNYPKLIFMKDNGRLMNGVMFQGELMDILSPTILYSPYLVKRGEFDKQVADIEKKVGKFPRLKNAGKVE
jgi:hypothetical protein